MLRHICPKIWGIDKLFGFCDLTKVQNYPSIFRINPRYIDYDLVQVYYADTSDIPRLIIHELLHFHYYWTLKKQDPEMMKKYHFDEDPLWILSEVINVVWENTPEMQNIIQKKEE
ncbi:MAG: hypothetical protein U9Q15_00705 [Patescibacteria group bacterium]|nr:hypothetical protein [Patescibacteria group bacterium]